jgi:hypothetical protein
MLLVFGLLLAALSFGSACAIRGVGVRRKGREPVAEGGPELLNAGVAKCVVKLATILEHSSNCINRRTYATGHHFVVRSSANTKERAIVGTSSMIRNDIWTFDSDTNRYFVYWD